MHSDLVISQSDGRPMYLQIMEQIRQRVAVGDWPRGEEIPSIRQLAIALKVSVITVKRAYMELEREGVIVTQQGKGSVVAMDADLRPRLYDAELAEHLDQVARLGVLLGLSAEELAERVSEAKERWLEKQGPDKQAQGEQSQGRQEQVAEEPVQLKEVEPVKESV